MDLVPHRRHRGQWLAPWERFFDEPFFSDFPALFQQGRKGMFVPGVDVSETDKEVQVVADVPGYTKDNIEVNVEDGVLTLRGTMKEEKEEKDKKYYCKQCASGSFCQQIALPSGAQEEKAKCAMKDGKLTVTIPKRAVEEKKGKTLTIESE